MNLISKIDFCMKQNLTSKPSNFRSILVYGVFQIDSESKVDGFEISVFILNPKVDDFEI